MIGSLSALKRAFSGKPATVAAIASEVPAPHLQSLSPGDVGRLLHLLDNVPAYRDEINSWNSEVASLIQNLILSRVPPENLSSILAGLASYRSTGITSERSHQSFVQAYCNTSGLFQELLHQILFQVREDDRLALKAPVSKMFGAIDETTRDSILSELGDSGYCVLPFRLSNETIVEIKKRAQVMTYSLRERADESVPTTISGINPSNPPACVAAYASNSQVLSDSVLVDLLNDPLIVSLASSHMKANVTAIDATLWYSFPSHSPSSESAQLFHFDLDTIRWLKVFYYLTDVNHDSGPHSYIEGSHKPGAKTQHLLNQGYARISDNDIDQMQPGSMKTITGPAGTIILGDTRCFHKGTHLRADNRLIFSPIYAPSKVGYFQGASKPE